MLVSWLVDVALAFVGVFFGLFDFLPEISLPAAPSVTVAVPVLGATGVAGVGSWFVVAVPVFSALIIGSVLQWIYAKIPFKGT